MGENLQSNPINIFPTACFPSPSVLREYCRAGKFLIEGKETYVKQSIRNRYIIEGPNSLLTLTVPIKKPNGSKTRTEDIVLDFTQNWQKLHLESLKTAYNNTPYFEHYEYELRDFFRKNNRGLLDWNSEFLSWLAHHLDLTIEFSPTSDYFQNSPLHVMNPPLSEKNSNEDQGQWSVLHHLFLHGPMVRQLIV